jgi:hypothetical protein
MLAAQQFRDKWQVEVVANSKLPDDERLVTVPPERLASLRLSPSAREYLSEAGLPKACGPCLSFEEGHLPRLWEVFSPSQWRPEEKVGLEHYLMIGSDGAGNPLCIDERDGRVVLLDHELLFDVRRRDSRTMFVNSGIPEFAQFLLAYHRSPSGSYWPAFCEIDPPATEKGAFWSYERPGTNDQKQNVLWRVLCFRLGRSDTFGTRWFWILIAAALGLILALVINKWFRR